MEVGRVYNMITDRVSTAWWVAARSRGACFPATAPAPRDGRRTVTVPLRDGRFRRKIHEAPASRCVLWPRGPSHVTNLNPLTDAYIKVHCRGICWEHRDGYGDLGVLSRLRSSIAELVGVGTCDTRERLAVRRRCLSTAYGMADSPTPFCLTPRCCYLRGEVDRHERAVSTLM